MPVEDEIRAALVAAEKSYTLGEIAGKAGLHVTGVSRFKNKLRGGSMSLASLEKLAEALGGSVVFKKGPKKP